MLKEKLDQQIKKFIQDKLSFNEFEDVYIRLMFNSGESFGNHDEEKFYEEINEKMQFSSANPNQEDRKVGYINADEFKKWLKEKTNTR